MEIQKHFWRPKLHGKHSADERGDNVAKGWYLAEIVMKLTVDGDTRNEVHQNLFLIQAETPDESYAKAMKCGKDEETSYENPAGKTVHVTFEGLSDLVDIEGELEDGAELMFHRRVNVSEKRLRTLVLPKERLRLFGPRVQTKGPDFSSSEVLDLLEREYGTKRTPEGDWVQVDPKN